MFSWSLPEWQPGTDPGDELIEIMYDPIDYYADKIEREQE